MCIIVCFKAPTCTESLVTLVAEVNNILCDFFVSVSQGLLIRLIYISKSEAVKRLISCVNLLVNLHSMCLNFPTCTESLVTLAL